MKRHVWFLLHYHPTREYFLHPDKKLLPAIIYCDQFARGEKTIMALFEEFK